MQKLLRELRTISRRALADEGIRRQERKKQDEEQALFEVRRITSKLPSKLRQEADYGLRSSLVYEFEHQFGRQTYCSECMVKGLKEWAERRGLQLQIQESGSRFIPNHVYIHW
ncbi:MAG TPA: hypothetical protein VJC12_02560 [Candidatus Paceibacterota bacterium]